MAHSPGPVMKSVEFRRERESTWAELEAMIQYADFEGAARARRR